MNEAQRDPCRVPVVAEYRIADGRPVMVSAQYAEIPAAELLRFLLERGRIRIGSEGKRNDLRTD